MSKTALVKSLGLRIRQCRIASGLSQEALADKAGIHRTYIGLVERGETNITISNFAKISSALEVPLHSLLYELEVVPSDKYL